MKMTVFWDNDDDDRGSKHIWSVGQLLRDYWAQHPRRQSSSQISALLITDPLANFRLLEETGFLLSTVILRILVLQFRRIVGNHLQEHTASQPRRQNRHLHRRENLKRIFPLAYMSRPVLRPTQLPTQRVPGILFPGVKLGRGVTLTIHPHLVPRSRMTWSYISSPPWRLHSIAGQLYFTYFRLVTPTNFWS
jgi:hypothetical protein